MISALYSFASSWINIPILKLINITIWKILSPFPVGIIWILISCFWGWVSERIRLSSALYQHLYECVLCRWDIALMAMGGMSSIMRLAWHFIVVFLNVAWMFASSAPGPSCLPQPKSLNKYVICLFSDEWHMLPLFMFCINDRNFQCCSWRFML